MTSTLNLVKKGKSFAGKIEYITYLEGKHVTHKQRILAKCYDCMGYCEDGKNDCKQKECPLYGVMKWAKTKE